jgi:hypothetical protein
MYHLELRKFPHVVCRFNQSEAQLRSLVVPWTRQEWIEEGERKWNVNEATLTILEGPKLSMPELAMGKGWRNAQKRSQDVTEQVLGAARQVAREAQGQHGGASPGAVARAAEGAGAGEYGEGGGTGPAPVARTSEALRVQDRARELDLLGDSLGLELLAMLDGGAVVPSRVWLMAQERLAEGRRAVSAAEALALAERAVGSLLGRGLAVLRRDGGEQGGGGGRGAADGRAERGGQAGEVVASEQQEAVLAAVATWAGGDLQSVVIARKG